MTALSTNWSMSINEWNAMEDEEQESHSCQLWDNFERGKDGSIGGCESQCDVMVKVSDQDLRDSCSNPYSATAACWVTLGQLHTHNLPHSIVYNDKMQEKRMAYGGLVPLGEKVGYK